MRNVFRELDILLANQSTILNVVDEVAELRTTITDSEELQKFVNHVRTIVQNEARDAVIRNNGRGLVAMATGSGKSKIAIDLSDFYCNNVFKEGTDTDLPLPHSIIVPTEKLRDENWHEEYVKWGKENLYNTAERLCYASAFKTEGSKIRFVILDEVHNITELSAKYFVGNNVEHVVALTATPPTSQDKIDILKALNIPLVYHLSLDNAVKLGFVAPYKINVVFTELNSVDKYVESGTKTKRFYQTELQKYSYLSMKVMTAMNYSQDKFRATMNRMRFIYNLRSKTEAGKYILDNLIPQDDRTLIFCGSIAQAEELSPHYYHSKSKDKDFELFKNGELDRLSCVKAINEGHNFIGLDSGLITQLNSNEKDLIQRIGRLIRFRPGHEAVLWIVVSKGTQDEVWMNEALKNLDSSKITYINFADLKEAA